MGRPRQHDERTRLALLQAAEAIAAAEGADGVSVRRVAERAGTTTRAVYSLFESKEGLLAALGNRAFEILNAWTREVEATDDPVADLVEGTVAVFRRWAMEHPALFRIGLLREEISADLAERFRPARLQALEGLVTLIGRALGLTGGFSNPTLMEATAHFDALCEGLVLLELRGALPKGQEEAFWRHGPRALLAGLQANIASLPGAGELPDSPTYDGSPV